MDSVEMDKKKKKWSQIVHIMDIPKEDKSKWPKEEAERSKGKLEFQMTWVRASRIEW